MTKRRSILFLVFTLIMALVFTGCTARKPMRLPNQPEQTYTNKGATGTTTNGVINGNNNNIGISGTNVNPTLPGNNTAVRYGGNTGTNIAPSLKSDLVNTNKGTTGTGYSATGTNGTAGTGYSATGTGYGTARNTAAGTNNLTAAAQSVSGVSGAVVVVSGNTAYVGINIDVAGTGANNTAIANIKQQVARQIRATDRNITTVYVSADPDFFQRISNIGTDIGNGKTVQGFRTQLTELVKRLTPEKE